MYLPFRDYVVRIILAILFVMVTGTAHAACDHLSQASRVNPTELSKYQECWLDEHKSDEVSGVLGSLFYVKLAPGHYVSLPVNDIRKQPRDQATNYIDLVINKKIHKDLIEAARKELDHVRHQLSQTYALAIVLGVTPEIQERVIELIELEEQLYNSLQGANK